MQIIVAVSYFNNRKVLKTASTAFEYHFPGIEMKMILSSGATPYKDFSMHYEKALADGLDGDTLKDRMTKAFKEMELENTHLVEAMKKDREKREGK
jgi:hypothetical protein